MNQLLTDFRDGAKRVRPVVELILTAAIGGAVSGAFDAIFLAREGFIIDWLHVGRAAQVGALVAVGGLLKSNPWDRKKVEQAKAIIASDTAKPPE